MQQVKQAQSAYRLASQLRRIAPGQYFTLSLHGSEAANPRFQLTVVDTSSQHTAGVLLVPQGRETAYAFGERKGQEEVRCLSLAFQSPQVCQCLQTSATFLLDVLPASCGPVLWSHDLCRLWPGSHLWHHGRGPSRAVSSHAAGRVKREAIGCCLVDC